MKQNRYGHQAWKKKGSLKDSSGQIVVEYILLLVIGVAVAVLITTLMVSRDPNSTGFMIQKWNALLQTIAADPADDLS